jgi:hypothetical protein
LKTNKNKGFRVEGRENKMEVLVEKEALPFNAILQEKSCSAN